MLLKELNCFVGACAIITINEFNGNKFFLSTAAISIKGGLSDIYQPDSDEIKRKMFKKSKESICLVYSNKFNRIGQSVVASIPKLDKIITDSNCTTETREEFAHNGKPLIIT